MLKWQIHSHMTQWELIALWPWIFVVLLGLGFLSAPAHILSSREIHEDYPSSAFYLFIVLFMSLINGYIRELSFGFGINPIFLIKYGIFIIFHCPAVHKNPHAIMAWVVPGSYINGKIHYMMSFPIIISCFVLNSKMLFQ